VGGTISYNTYATTGISGAAETVSVVVPVPSSIFPHLVEGQNVITVEVHQNNATFTDLVMDLSLSVRFAAAPAIPTFGIGDANAVPFLYWLNDDMILQSSTNLGVWKSEPTYQSPFFLPIEPEITRKFWRLSEP
jgi:hypothetical protein